MRQIAALGALGLGMSSLSGGTLPVHRGSWPEVDYLPAEPKPLTKRQRRRLRGKSKS